ncbi:MAG TPA: LCP family protein [Candidatus Sulfotelmatobacter sp.]|nr:LCP family protein [Candidatus Sulfotelmatobacter sp.]
MSKYLIADPPPPAPPGGPRRRSQPPSGGGGVRHFMQYLAGALLILIGVAFGAIALRMLQTHRSFSDAAISYFVATPQEAFGKDRIYVMILGIDYDYTLTDQPFSSHSRSDTIMVAGMDFPSRTVKVFSVLRDTGVLLNGHLAKINGAYSDGGAKEADQVIGSFLGMPTLPNGRHFDKYVVINTAGLKDVVDAIGGIDVPVTETMNYDDSWGHLHIHFKPGVYHMNGYQAQAYSRFRHDACSDPCRTKRQQQVIRIILAKLQANKFNDIAHIPELIGVMNRNIKTDLTFDQEKSLAVAFKDVKPAQLLSKMDTIGYTGTQMTRDGEVLIPDEAQKARFVADLLGVYGTPPSPPPSALAAVKPVGIHVVVENGSGVKGLAGAVAAKLRKAGYTVDSVGNADAFTYDTTQIRPATTVPLVGERVRQDLGLPAAVVSPATDATPGPHPVVTVIAGQDLAAALSAATAVATPSTPRP